MSELRWNPLLQTYTMIATNRQSRPHLPSGNCPFCPGNGKVPDQYDIYIYPNDFPALSIIPGVSEEDFYNKSNKINHTAPSYGKCEVVLYSSDHHTFLYKLSLSQIEKLISVWKHRQEVLSLDQNIKYIFPFENKGEEVGVTIHHPHGQLYAYPFVPLKVKTELESCRQYFLMHHEPLFEALNRYELNENKRIIDQDEHFIAYIPYFTDYPYGVFIVCKQNIGSFAQFTSDMTMSLALMLKKITGAFDLVFDRPFPYMMCIHQTPVNCPEYDGSEDWFRFHIEFYPPLREKNRVKWYASSEMGAWAAANTLSVEETAIILKKSVKKFSDADEEISKGT